MNADDDILLKNHVQGRLTITGEASVDKTCRVCDIFALIFLVIRCTKNNQNLSFLTETLKTYYGAFLEHIVFI